MVGVLGVAAIFAVNNNTLEESMAVSGSWADFVSTAWANESDTRYEDYTLDPGSAQSAPYLIKTAEEFSGIRAFEGDDALAGKYLLIANDIDLSAHYWDPIELYGYGDPVDDTYNSDDNLNQPDARFAVNLDGNSKTISGMNIDNTYDEVFGTGIFYGDSFNIGATGLFNYTYMANISNIRLDSPVINLTETAGVPMWENDYNYSSEVRVIDVFGSVVGSAQRSHIANVYVSDPEINYTAEFGDYVNGMCVRSIEDSCGNFYSPFGIYAGGAVGLSFGETLISETMVRGGTVNVRPVVDETITGDTMYALDDGGTVSVAGLVGVNLESTILSTCSSADVVFSDDGYDVYDRSNIEKFSTGDDEEPRFFAAAIDEDRPLEGYGMLFGGLVGYTQNYVRELACVYNSCSHSELNIDAEIASFTAIGGVAAYVQDDRIMNNYYDGNIVTSDDNLIGEIIGAVFFDEYRASSSIRNNYHLERGREAVGLMDDDYNIRFTPITTLEKLTSDLNTGRSMVISMMTANSDYSAAAIESMTTEWAVLEGTYPLACSNEKTVGLLYEDLNIDVPNTGAK